MQTARFQHPPSKWPMEVAVSVAVSVLSSPRKIKVLQETDSALTRSTTSNRFYRAIVAVIKYGQIVTRSRRQLELITQAQDSELRLDSCLRSPRESWAPY